MLLVSGVAHAQQNDPTIMTINGQPVSRSEFEYSYNKNNSEGGLPVPTMQEQATQWSKQMTFSYF